MNDTQSGIDKARETAEKIKAENLLALEKEAQAKKDTQELLSEKHLAPVSVQGIEVPSEVAEMFRSTSQVGMENISSQSLPELRVIEEKSKARLADGSRIPAGRLFYTPTKEVFEKVDVAITYISQGFYTTKKDKDGNDKKKPDGTKETRFNQLVGGMMLQSMQPFVLFAAGIRWKPLNDFVKLVHPFTKHKTMPIPLYAFQVELSSTPVDENFAVQYTLKKNVAGMVQITTDKTVNEVLLASVDQFKERFIGFIERFEVDRFTGELLSDQERALEEVTQTPDPIHIKAEDQEAFLASDTGDRGLAEENTDTTDVSD